MKRNAYFVHPENILLPMLAEDDTVQKHAMDKTVCFRKTNVDQARLSVNIRCFAVPKLNLRAKSFYEMANLDGSDIRVPH